MNRTHIYAAVLVTALAAALALSAPPQVAEGPHQDLDSLKIITTGLTVSSNTATETVVFSDEEGRIIEVAVAEYRSSTTTTSAPSASSELRTTTTTSGSAKAGTTTTTTKPPSTTTTAASNGGYNSAYESEFYSLINSFREANGLPALTRDGSLNSRARNWAEYLSREGELKHSNLSSLIPPWTAAGENVGAGYSVSGLFNAFKNSSYHKSVMLGNYTHAGIGVWVDADGTIWTVHLFAHD